MSVAWQRHHPMHRHYWRYLFQWLKNSCAQLENEEELVFYYHTLNLWHTIRYPSPEWLLSFLLYPPQWVYYDVHSAEGYCTHRNNRDQVRFLAFSKWSYSTRLAHLKMAKDDDKRGVSWTLHHITRPSIQREGEMENPTGHAMVIHNAVGDE